MIPPEHELEKSSVFMSGRPVRMIRGKCEDSDTKPNSGTRKVEGWWEPTFSSEIRTPFSQVVDPLPGDTAPIFPAEVVEAKMKD
jgi:hypothetical protein